MSLFRKKETSLTPEEIAEYRLAVEQSDYEKLVMLLIKKPALLKLETDENTSILLKNATETNQTRTVEDILMALVDEIFKGVLEKSDGKNMDEVQSTLDLFVQALLQLWSSMGSQMSLKDFIEYIKGQKKKLKGKKSCQGLWGYLDGLLADIAIELGFQTARNAADEELKSPEELELLNQETQNESIQNAEEMAQLAAAMSKLKGGKGEEINAEVTGGSVEEIALEALNEGRKAKEVEVWDVSGMNKSWADRFRQDGVQNVAAQTAKKEEHDGHATATATQVNKGMVSEEKYKEALKKMQDLEQHKAAEKVGMTEKKNDKTIANDSALNTEPAKQAEMVASLDQLQAQQQNMSNGYTYQNTGVANNLNMLDSKGQSTSVANEPFGLVAAMMDIARSIVEPVCEQQASEDKEKEIGGAEQDPGKWREFVDERENQRGLSQSKEGRSLAAERSRERS